MRASSIILVSLAALAASNETPATAADAQIEAPTAPVDADLDLSSIPTSAPEIDHDTGSEDELKIRQAPGQVIGADVPNSPDPTQMSPVTTFMKYGPNGEQTPVLYTQTFAQVPEQWEAPKSGSIGLGGISGQIGVVKTNVKRNYIAEATAAIKRGVRALEKRKGKGGGGSSGGGNAASGLTVPLLSVAAALSVGILAVAL